MKLRRPAAAAVIAVVISAPLITPATPANAVPPGFPNIDDYTPVDPSTLMNMNKGWQSIGFYPASKHYSCTYTIGGSVVPEGSTSPLCEGDIPGTADTPVAEPITEGCSRTYVKPNQVFRKSAKCESYRDNITQSSGHELLPGQKVSVGSVTCVQDEGDRTACIDGTHGFIISPERTWAF